MQVFIAGKEASLRNALTTLLQTRPGIEIAGAAADKKNLFAQVESDPSDLLLLDETLSQELVKEIIIPLQQFDPCPAILVLGGRAEAKQAYLDAGAVAVINKGDPPKYLLTAIEEIRLRKNHV
jgi:DNA-binding NarL/FixJ family response regulator